MERATRPTAVAVAGGKGGCGKTTTALGMGLALVRRGRRPVVVDADVDVPDLHIRAEVDRDPGLPALAAGGLPERVCQPSPVVRGVDVLPAGGADRVDERVLRRLVDLGRPVVVDCPAGAGPDAAAPLRVADATVLVTTDAPASRTDAAKTAAMARALDARPVATVVRNRGEPGAAPADGQASRASARSANGPALRSTAIAVPEVDHPPLRDERLLDGFEAATRAAFGPGDGGPAAEPGGDLGSRNL